MAVKLITLSAVTITTAGTRVQISSQSISTPAVAIQADVDNTGNVFVGDSSVDSSNGIELSPGKVYEYAADDIRGIGEQVVLSDIYVDAQTNGDKVKVQYIARR